MKQTKRNKYDVGVITYPFSDNVGKLLLSNFIKVLKPTSNRLLVITGEFPESHNKKTKIIQLRGFKEASPVIKIIRQILIQIEISILLIKLRREVDIILFFIGAGFILPMVLAKFLKKRTIIVLTGSVFSMYRRKEISNFEKVILTYISEILEKISYHISDRIIVYSKSQKENINKYRNKISIAHEHFLDFDKFKIKKEIGERDNLVGYIGRLSEEKGVLSFVKAITEILEKENEIKILIGGDGQLRDEIERYLEDENLNDKVKLVGWIPHDELPDYLNELKLVVLPSYTEGLPNIMLEAMACGTPVLATPVGAIPDVIKDEKIGFILENNSPECIVKNVLRALEHPDLERIVENAMALVEREFTYEVAVEKYRKILENLGVKNHE